LPNRARHSTCHLNRETLPLVPPAFRKRVNTENPATLSMLLVPLRRTLPKSNPPAKLRRKHTVSKLVRRTRPDFRAAVKGIADADLGAIADAPDMIGLTTDVNAKNLAIHSKRDGRPPSNHCRENPCPK